MIRIAICDDEETICSLVESYIANACEFLNIEAEIDLFSTGAGLRNHLKEDNRYNLFFLDIELKDDTGINISDWIRNEVKDESAQIIYVSGKKGYDRQLFAFRPFAYIEKPFDEATIRTTLEKYMRIYGNHNNLFHYKFGHDTFWVNVSSILYFKSNRRKVKMTALNAADEFYGSLDHIAEQLDGQGFFSPHKSYLVNYRYIRAFYAESILMVNGDEIPIAKSKREEVAKMQLHFENGGSLHGTHHL